MLRASYKTAEELGGQRLYCLGSLLANISTEIAAAHGWRHSRAASGVAAGLVECSTWAAASIRAAGLSSRRWRLRWRLLPRSDSLHRHDRRHGGSLRRQRARPVAGSMPQHPVRVAWPASSANSGRQRLDGEWVGRLQLYPECPILSRVSWECPILSGVSNTVRSVRFETGHVNTWYCPECVRSCPECVRSCPECVRNVSGDAVRSCPKRVSGMSGNVR